MLIFVEPVIPEIRPDHNLASSSIDAPPEVISTDLVSHVAVAAPLLSIADSSDVSNPIVSAPDPIVSAPDPLPSFDLPSSVLADWSSSEACEWFTDFLTSVS